MLNVREFAINSTKEIAGTLTWTHAIEHEAAQVQLIREHRVSGEHDVAFGARPFILCGMPIRRLPKGTLSYRRRNGKFFLEIVGHPEWGVPFGQDRLVLLYLATNAIRHKSATVWFRRGAEILLEWGMPTNGIYYDRLMLAFQRIFGSTMFFGSSEDQRETKGLGVFAHPFATEDQALAQGHSAHGPESSGDEWFGVRELHGSLFLQPELTRCWRVVLTS